VSAIRHEFTTYTCDGCFSDIAPKQEFIAIYRGTVRAEDGQGAFAGNDGSWSYHFHVRCFNERLSAQLTHSLDFERRA